jgi:hypothetical protein
MAQLHVSCYTDIDLGGQHETRQSTGGYLLFINGALVHYHGLTERLIIASTAAGEYIAMSRGQAACQFLTRVLQFYGNTQIQSHLYTDNQAAEHIATQPNMNEHSRSIDIRHHAVRQAYLDRIIDVKGVKTTENPSDITTKYLPAPTHITHAQYLNIHFPSISPQTTPNKLRFTNNGTTLSYRSKPLPSQRAPQNHRSTLSTRLVGFPPITKQQRRKVKRRRQRARQRYWHAIHLMRRKRPHLSIMPKFHMAPQNSSRVPIPRAHPLHTGNHHMQRAYRPP